MCVLKVSITASFSRPGSWVLLIHHVSPVAVVVPADLRKTVLHAVLVPFSCIFSMVASSAPSDSSITQSAQDIPVAPVAAPAPLPGPFPADNQPRIHDAPPQVNPGVNQNLQMNAQGGPVMEEDEVNRDWLDWLYSATLFYVLVNVVYFYSSLSRLLMVMVGTLLMYLHQGRLFPFRQRQVQPAQNNVPPQDAVNQDQNNNLPEENIGDPGEMEASEAVPENQPATPSFMSTAWLFFKAFFASLLPEGTPAVAN
ncbi:hypothetical protein lerEdw1_001063 [Lerista edwardsae]|nr:hypothetical protein lerEdw1_001063 [Lerista edwardsae]